MSTVRGPLWVAAGIVVVISLSVLTAPRGPAASSALPPAPDDALIVLDTTVADAHAAAGITVTAGWTPSRIFGDVDPWSLLDPVEGVRPWADVLPGLRIAYDPSGRLLVEDAVVVRDPARCYHLARVVRRVAVGLAPPAGPAIAEQVEGWLAPPYFSAVRPPAGSGPCTGRGRTAWGFAIEQAEPLACSVPGRETMCVTVAKWRFDFRARDEWTTTHLVFDVSDGSQLLDDELHPQLDVVALDALVEEVLCAAGGRCDGVQQREGRLHPTPTALVVELSPGEGAHARHGSLRVTIPRSALPLRTTGG
jgi:hypothetical protein